MHISKGRIGDRLRYRHSGATSATDNDNRLVGSTKVVYHCDIGICRECVFEMAVHDSAGEDRND
jgi:hypothetical protein